MSKKAENYGLECVSLKRRVLADISCNDMNGNDGRKRMKGSVGKAQEEKRSDCDAAEGTQRFSEAAFSMLPYIEILPTGEN